VCVCVCVCDSGSARNLCVEILNNVAGFPGFISGKMLKIFLVGKILNQRVWSTGSVQKNHLFFSPQKVYYVCKETYVAYSNNWCPLYLIMISACKSLCPHYAPSFFSFEFVRSGVETVLLNAALLLNSAAFLAELCSSIVCRVAPCAPVT
jgi:hypothetical protein